MSKPIKLTPTLSGKDADNFIKKMIKTENSPISKIDEEFVKRMRKPKNLFVWYATRIGFWVMLTIWVLSIFLTDYSIDPALYGAIGLLFIIVIIFTFVNSIIHLVKYKEKSLAITSLVISSIGILIILIEAIKIFQ